MNKTSKLLTIIIFSASSLIYALNTTSFVFFGDSLSDTGNNERFSDGELWPEFLAKKLDLPAPRSSGVGGLNFAYSGAKSGNEEASDTVNVGNQIKAYLDINEGKADPEAVYLIWIGGNDFLDKRNPFDLIENITGHIETLVNAGATRFFVPNLPSLVHTPKGEEMVREMADTLMEYLHDSFEAVVTPVVKQCIHEGLCIYNLLLERRLKSIESSRDIVIYHLDVYSIFNKVIESPESYGFANKTELFYDSLHPSAKGHELIADSAMKILELVGTKNMR
jgi:phospholipase/lecithinase/hemolysin